MLKIVISAAIIGIAYTVLVGIVVTSLVALWPLTASCTTARSNRLARGAAWLGEGMPLYEPCKDRKDQGYLIMRQLRKIWRDIVPLVLTAVALLIVFYTRSI
jgi:hypothetical protein